MKLMEICETLQERYVPVSLWLQALLISLHQAMVKGPYDHIAAQYVVLNFTFDGQESAAACRPSVLDPLPLPLLAWGYPVVSQVQFTYYSIDTQSRSIMSSENGNLVHTQPSHQSIPTSSHLWKSTLPKNMAPNFSQYENPFSTKAVFVPVSRSRLNKDPLPSID